MDSNINLFADLEEKRGRLCNAAVEIFSYKSYDKTTVSEISREAGVGKGTFYLYFDSKDELLNFLLKYGIEQLIKYVNNNLNDAVTPLEKLEKAIDAQLKFFNRFNSYFTFFIRELWSYREGLQEQISRLKDKYIMIFDEIIEEGKYQGLFKDINTETVGSGIFGFLSISSFHWVLFAQNLSEKDVNSSIKEVIFNGIKL